ncbi:MAG: hypothetical protein TREMPRED_000645 [Tremellales sp. Tagirdzhanova-0007]|nr:MAG: hypothetical protein TREMPRED_000645 [Tremellales sp. Tagirdzhanova-0007]
MSLVTQPHANTSSSSNPSGSHDTETSQIPPTPLKTQTSSTGFVFPAIWSFPPFFTLQPNPTTQAHQLTLWTTLILDWARHDRVFSVNCDALDAGQVFRNKIIDRRLLPNAMREVMSSMTKNGYAAPDPPKQTAMYLLYWRKPDEWATLIHDWITANGFNASIMTFYEITDGDLSESTEFRQLPEPMLRKALESLVKRGKAQMLRGEGEAGEGVRFL